jgi:hypothetical protein
LQEYRGMRAKLRDDRLVFGKPRVSLAKRPHEGVSGLLNHQIHDQRPRLDPIASVCADGCARLTGGTGVAATWGQRG